MKNNPLVNLFGSLWHYSSGNRKVVALFWCMFVVNEAINLFLQPLLLAKILNSIQDNHGVNRENFPQLLWYLVIMFGSTILFWTFHGPARILERSNAFKARINYRKFLLSGVMSLPMEWHAEHHSGDTVDKIEKGTNALYDFGGTTFVMMYSLTRLVVCLGMLAYLSHFSVVIALVMMGLSAWITIRFDRVLIPQYRSLSHAENKISESVLDAIGNISTVIILRVEKLVFNAIVGKIEKPYDLFLKNAKMSECKWFLTSVCCRIMICLTLGAYFWEQSRVAVSASIGVCYLMVSYLEKVSDLFARFCELYGDVVIRRTRVSNAEELSDDFKANNLGNHVLPNQWKNLEVKNLSFSYHGIEGDMHLNDISLSIGCGERIALIGESGSGKTTLLKLMRDLYHPQEVNLSVDGQLITEGFAGISRAIALVPQNPEIFATTIERNITLGAEHLMSLIMKYVDMACFRVTLEALPKRLESSVNEKGVNLSGGQQQRLALARGLLACHDKDIVLLDEPTSSLDTPTEMKVYQNIFRGFKGKTIVSSIHRLHLLPLFDRIYMFDKGKIIAVGSFRELLMESPDFQKIWSQYSTSNEIKA